MTTPMAMRMAAAREEVRSTCQRIDLNIRRKEPTTKAVITKITTTRRVRVRKVVIKKEEVNHTTRSTEWANPRIKELPISQTFSHISRTCNKWTSLKSKSYL